MMTTNAALEILRQHETDLRARGVRRAAVFGSVANGTATTASDLDIVIEIDDASKLTVYDYVAVKRSVAALFPVRVDVVNADLLKPAIGVSASRDAVYAF